MKQNERDNLRRKGDSAIQGKMRRIRNAFPWELRRLVQEFRRHQMKRGMQTGELSWGGAEREAVRRDQADIWQALRESKQREAFLLKLTDALRPLRDPAVIQREASRVLREHLGASRVVYWEAVSEDELIPGGADYASDAIQRSGKYKLSDYSPELALEFLAGRPVFRNDSASDPRLSTQQRAAFAAAGVGGWAGVPLVKDGRLIALLGASFAGPHGWSPFELALMQEVAERTWATVERARIEEALREKERQLAAELAGAKALQAISGRLISESDPQALYSHIVEAAIELMNADAASIQILEPDGNSLKLLGSRGFHPDSAAYWDRVDAGSSSTCGLALRGNERVVVQDVNAEEAMAGTEDLRAYLRSGLHAVQSTPLKSRSGRFLGMLSTHWRQPHKPVEQDFRLFDALARQAADLLERTISEAALRESEAKYRTLFSSIDAGFCILKLMFDSEQRAVDFRYIEINPAFEKQTGLKNALGKTIRELIPNIEEFWCRVYGNVALTGEPKRFIDHVASLGRWFDVYAFRIGEPHERKVAVLFNDITERKTAEAALAQAQQKLEQHASMLEETVAERTAKLRETIRDLEHFSYTITHDMRAPLRAMQGFGEILIEDCQDALDEVGRGYVRRIIAAANRMDHLITDALNYSKAVQAEIVLEPVAPGALLHEIVESYPQFHGRGSQIQIVGDFPDVLGNRAGLTQCFSNLLDNAVKFVPPGRTPSVRVWAELRDPFIRLWFEDNGIGIPAEQREQVFGMFQQLDRSYPGTGIGLALVRKVAQRMQGDVGVESTTGQGSRFWLELRRASAVFTRY